MRKIWLILLLVVGILTFPIIGTAAFLFTHTLNISDPAKFLLLGFILIFLGMEGLKNKLF